MLDAFRKGGTMKLEGMLIRRLRSAQLSPPLWFWFFVIRVFFCVLHLCAVVRVYVRECVIVKRIGKTVTTHL